MTIAQRMAHAPPPTVAQLQTHAQQVALAFTVRLIECPQLRPDEAFAVPQLRAVFMTAIGDETTYAVAMHELGHLLSPTGSLRGVVRGDPMKLTRDEEDAAWAWARHHAIVWTPAMEAVAQWAEGTYHAAPSSPPPPETPQPPTSRIDWTRYR